MPIPFILLKDRNFIGELYSKQICIVEYQQIALNVDLYMIHALQLSLRKKY